MSSSLWCRGLTSLLYQRDCPGKILELVAISFSRASWGVFPGDAGGKESACQFTGYKRCRFDPWVCKIPWRSVWQLTPVFLPEEFHGQRSPWLQSMGPQRVQRNLAHSMYADVCVSMCVCGCVCLCVYCVYVDVCVDVCMDRHLRNLGTSVE